MVLTAEDRCLIKECYVEKGWKAARLLSEFPGKNWRKRSVQRLLKNIRETGSNKRKVGSGRPKSAKTPEFQEYVADNILSQEDKPGTHLSQRQIAKNLKISQTSVHRIVK